MMRAPYTAREMWTLRLWQLVLAVLMNTESVLYSVLDSVRAVRIRINKYLYRTYKMEELINEADEHV